MYAMEVDNVGRELRNASPKVDRRRRGDAEPE
jgi:hypothetical protein